MSSSKMKTITKKIASMLLSQKIIKPSSSSSSSLFRPHNLSLIDYTMVPAYIPIASFYPKPPNHDIGQVSQILENSLSKVLSSYYPFAGRIIDDKYVDCNDEHIGVEYLNVHINCPMSEILNHTYNDAIDVVFPQDLPWSSSVNRRLLVVQLSHFDCGGIGVSICISHKIVDAYSACKFLNDWAITARGDELDFKPSPLFNAASFFPLRGDRQIPSLVVRETQPCVSRTYHFSSSSLNQLKNIVSTNSRVHNPTRVEVATALIHKCAKETNSGLFRPSSLSHIMNLRPPLPLNTIGNGSIMFSLITNTEDEIQMPRFIAQLRNSKQECRDKWKDNNNNNTSPLDRLVSALLEQDKVCAEIFEKSTYDTYLFSSLCNIRFYDTDFGWGRPIRVTLARHRIKNAIVFIDDPNGDGINALISLEEDDLLRFQSNKELLEFASPVARLPE